MIEGIYEGLQTYTREMGIPLRPLLWVLALLVTTAVVTFGVRFVTLLRKEMAKHLGR